MRNWFAVSGRRVGIPYILLIAFILLVRSIVPAGYMPSTSHAGNGWSGFIICYGQSVEPLKSGDTRAAFAHDDCYFGAAGHTVANAPEKAADFAPPILILAENMPVIAQAVTALSICFNQLARGPPCNENRYQT